MLLPYSWPCVRARPKSEIDRLSGKFAEKPRLLNMPDRRGLPRGLIATWEKVDLVPVVDRDAISALAAGESPRIGLLVDFLGDLHESAKLDLPLYRISGGQGMSGPRALIKRESVIYASLPSMFQPLI